MRKNGDYMTSVVSYPTRGKWGKSKYRGNCSGFIVKDLLELKYINPRLVYDPMAGSGTVGDVCDDLGIDCLLTDLNPKYGGVDMLKDEVPQSSDFIFWHPPYHDIIKYSGDQWGQKPHHNDLSRCGSYPEFIEKINKVHGKLLHSLRKGGWLAILIGDSTKGGYYPIFKDMDWYGQPHRVIIKLQHNCYTTDSKRYGGGNGNFIPQNHEYCILFNKDDCYVIPARIVKLGSYDSRNTVDEEVVPWKFVIMNALERLGGTATLQDLYKELEGHRRAELNEHWKAKVRQVVQIYPEFTRLDRGKYILTKLQKVA
ncbi:MAG: DNA methylase N-4/N-6 [bacterium]